jgi:general secretion pathway protein D
MRGKRARSLIVVALLFGLLLPAPVWAGGGKKNYKLGQALESDKKFDQAAEAYLAALTEDPNNIEYRIAYQRAATQASVTLVRLGRESMEQGHYEEAYNRFRRAYQFDKTNELAKDLTEQALNWQRKVEGITPVPVTETPYGATPPIIGQSLRQGTSASSPRPAPAAGDQADATEKDKVRENIIFRNQELEEIIRNIAQRLGLNVMFDSTFRSRKLNVELRGITLAQALDTLLVSNNLFFEPINDNTIVVSVDNTANRARLQQMSVQTFYLKSADPQIVQTQLTALFGQRVLAVPNAELRSLTVRTTPETLKLVSNMIRAVDKDKPEVLIDINIYEVSRNDLLEIGNQLLYSGFLGSSSPQGPIVPNSLNALGVTLGQIITEQRLALAIPTSIIRALQTRGNSRLIDSLQVHALDGKDVTANIGQRIPIQTASLPSAFASVNPAQQQPNQQNTQDRLINSLSLGVPQIEYQNVGLNVKIMPTIYNDDDVKLEMDIETSGVQAGPTSLTPVFTQRNLKSVATVKTGQAAMMAGVAQKRSTNTRTSLPVIGFLPVIGRFFSVPSQSNDTTDLLITVTPHVIRTADIRDEDKLAMSSGLQLMGVSESIESFLEKREQARLQHQQAAAPSDVAKTSPSPTSAPAQPPPASPPPEVAKTSPPSPSSPSPLATASLTELAAAGSGPGTSALVKTVSSQNLVAASPLVAESATSAASPTDAAVVNLQLQPNTIQPQVGDSLKVAAYAWSTQPIQQGSVALRFNPAVLKVKSVTDGGLLADGDKAARISANPDSSGTVVITVERAGKGASKPAQAPLVIIEFEVLSAGNSPLEVASEATKFTAQDGRALSCVSIPVAISAKQQESSSK